MRKLSDLSYGQQYLSILLSYLKKKKQKLLLLLICLLFKTLECEVFGNNILLKNTKSIVIKVNIYFVMTTKYV